jgi:phosphodiesterase/alkaline phosphatase D-like protein
MNKDIIIGGLVVALLLVVGYAALDSKGLFSNNSDTSMQNASTTATGTVTNPNGTITATDNTSNTSNTPGATRDITAPTVQTNTEATISNSTAFVSGKITPNGAQTSYWFDYGPTTALLNHTSKQDIGAGYAAITAPTNITGLKANTQYYFRLNAQNSIGITRGEVRSFTTNSTPTVPGKVPTVQTGVPSGVARSAANLNGRIDSNGNETTWWFEYGEKTTLGNVTTFGYVAANQLSTSVTASVSGLKPLTKYYYRINAQNQFGTVNGALSSFTTSGPAGASTPIIKTNAATSIGTSSVTMNAQLNPNGSYTTYWFEYSTDSLVSKAIGIVAGSNSTANQFMNGDDAAIGVKADVSGLSRSTKYYYRIVARNDFGTIAGDVMTFKTK